MVSIERAQGWSRQLRLTPLRPVAYIATKVVTAMVLGLAAVLVEFAIGAAVGVHAHGVAVDRLRRSSPGSAPSSSPRSACSPGYLLPSENVMQILGPVLAILAFAGGLFVPLQFLDPTVQTIAKLTPAYGVGELARDPADARRLRLGSRRQHRRLAGAVRRRRGAALPPGHEAGMSRREDAEGTTATVVPVARPELPAGVAVGGDDDPGRAVARGRLGWIFAAVWLVYLVPLLQEARRSAERVGARRRGRRGRRLRRRLRVVLSAAAPVAAAGLGSADGLAGARAGPVRRAVRRRRRHGWHAGPRDARVRGRPVGLRAAPPSRSRRRRSVRRGRRGARPAAGLVADGRCRVVRRPRLARDVGRDRHAPAQRRARAGAGDDRPAGRARTSAPGSPATCTTSSATR